MSFRKVSIEKAASQALVSKLNELVGGVEFVSASRSEDGALFISVFRKADGKCFRIMMFWKNKDKSGVKVYNDFSMDTKTGKVVTAAIEKVVPHVPSFKVEKDEECTSSPSIGSVTNLLIN